LAAGDYWQAWVQERAKKRLYTPKPAPITFMDETLFRTSLEMPETIARGTYTAEIYLVERDRLVAMQSTPITVQKRGMDALIYEMAQSDALAYGLLAVIIAVSLGGL